MNDKINESFKKKSRYVNIAFLISAVGLILIMYGTVYGISSGNMIIQSLGIIMFIGGIVINSIVWRCPVCKKPLPTRQSIKYINYCSNCNAKLK
jgi:ribosomal protein L37AE/L43A